MLREMERTLMLRKGAAALQGGLAKRNPLYGRPNQRASAVLY
jgi:hypothetical protein